MRRIRFLTAAEIFLIHQDQILNYGGLPGLRDSGLLSSALAMPESSFSGEYLHKSMYEMAAAYLFHLCQNHPFVDGNKRLGLASALVFLELNGVTLVDPGEELYDAVIKVSAGEFKKREIAEILERLAEDKG